MNWAKEKIIVTGGNGFLGKEIVRQLLSCGAKNVSVLCRSDCPELREKGVEIINGDIRNENDLISAFRNKTIIFHCAAKAGIWGTWEDFFSINALGTQNVVRAAYQNSVGILVNTSSPSVVIPPDRGLCGADESTPYPKKYFAHYPKTKAHAERIVSAATSDKLKTISIRPHLIWGPGDPHILPRIIKKASEGKLAQIGNGKNRVDITFVANAAHAHILAAEALRNSQKFSGKKYFVSDGAPVNLWDWINNFLKLLGIKPVEKKIPESVAFFLAGLCELKHRIFTPKLEPKLTRFTVMQLAHDHYFDISAIKKDLTYQPIISSEEAIKKTLTSFQS